jgi:hypothetical protein
MVWVTEFSIATRQTVGERSRETVKSQIRIGGKS